MENESSRFLPLAEPWLGAECANAVAAQISSSFVGPGATCAKFSLALAEFVGVKHCVLTTSGTVALSVAATALGLRAGDEVLIPAYGVISTINAFAILGLVPRLVDIDAHTACIDPAQLEKRITKRTKAICFVNFSGYTGDNLPVVSEIAASRGLPLIEDAACALGHCFESKRAGAFGTMSALSFSVPKALTTGQGGAVFSDSQEFADRASEYIDQGDLNWRQTNTNNNIGTNLRFNDVLAALGLAQLQSIEERLERRRKAYKKLREILPDELYTVPGDEAPLHNVIFSRDPDGLVKALRNQQIGAVRQYRTLSQHPPYRALADSRFANADFWTEHATYLPFGLALTEADAKRIGLAVRRSGVPLLLSP